MDGGQSLIRGSLLLQQLQGAAQAGQQRDTAGGHLKAAAVAVEGGAGREVHLALILQAAPADQGGLPAKKVGDGSRKLVLF